MPTRITARAMIEPHRLPGGQQVDFPGVVPKLSDTPGRTRWLGPALGAHTEAVLGELGFDADTVARLRRDGVI